jgi:hypothetical protein
MKKIRQRKNSVDVLAIIYFVVEIPSSARQSTHHYGLNKWKMDLELAQHSSVDFHNPDFVKFAGYKITKAADLLPIPTVFHSILEFTS